MSATQCTKTVYDHSMRFPRPHQCRRNAVVEREGKGYCKQHDPEAQKAREEERLAAERTQRQEQDAVKAEGARLAKQLGCGEVHFQFAFRGESGYRRALVVPFDDVERLVQMRELLNYLTTPAAGVFPDLVARIREVLDRPARATLCGSTEARIDDTSRADQTVASTNRGKRPRP